MKLIPQGNRLLVQLIDPKETNVTSPIKLRLVLPEEKDTYGMPRSGVVMAVGNGSECSRMDFKEGDIVFFSKSYGQPLKISPRTFAELDERFEENKTYLFLNTSNIYGRTYAKKNEPAPKKERAS